MTSPASSQEQDLLARLPARLRHRVDPHGDGRFGVPAWLRPTAGENRLAVSVAVIAAIVVQVALPDRLVLRPPLLLPTLEVLLLVVLVAANPLRIERRHPAVRVASLCLTAAMTLANAVSAAALIDAVVNGTSSKDAKGLLGSAAAIYATNIVAFGLWYWELDRGGAAARAAATRVHPDFLFPQMTSPELARENWQPEFLDYLYLSSTNATAFSPTDTLPLSRWAKALMFLQSAIALSTVGLVIARAVNVLP